MIYYTEANGRAINIQDSVEKRIVTDHDQRVWERGEREDDLNP